MRTSERGFTLIELLIVIAIIGILTATLVPGLMGARNRAYDSATMSYLRHCASALEISRDQNGVLPHPAPTTCEDAALGDNAQTRPGAVQSSQVTVTNNGTSYIITAVSQSGKTFNYDQNGFH